MRWQPRPAVTVADIAAIELRRIVEVLQVDHASLFLRDPEQQDRLAAVAAVGTAVDEALPEHAEIVAQVLETGRGARVQRSAGEGRRPASALALPLLADNRTLGVLLAVTLRERRRLGAIDAQVIGRATETLVDRLRMPSDRFRRPVASDRFARSADVSVTRRSGASRR